LPGRAPGRGHWLLSLFPPAERSRLPAGWLAAGYAAGFALLSGVALLRQAGLPATESLWAEDGAIFYNQAMSRPFLHTLVTAYNGYDQLVPRLLVQLARLWPVGDAAAVIAVSGAMGLGLLGCLVFHMSRGHIPSAALRTLLVASMVLLPVASVEMLDNLVNLPWWMFFAAFWALLWRPSTSRGRLGAGLLCALSAASEPLVGLLLPLAVLRLLAAAKRPPEAKEEGAAAPRPRRPKEVLHNFQGVQVMHTTRAPRASAVGPLGQAPVIGLLAGLAWQAGVVLAAGGEQSFPHADLAGIASNVWARVGLGWLTGLGWTDDILRTSRALAEGLGVAMFAAVVILGLWLGSRGARAFTVLAAIFSLLFFAVPVWLRGAGPLLGNASSVGYAGRYSAVPILIVVSAVLVLANSWARPVGARAGAAHMVALTAASQRARRPSTTRIPGRTGLLRPRALAATAICSALVVPQWVVGFRVPNARSHSPSWTSQVSAAAARCRGRPKSSLVRLATTPPGEDVLLSCGQLLRRR
jgi:hypothetical protein